MLIHPYIIEELEPRLLLSADPVSAAADEVLASSTLSQDISVVPLLDGETTSWDNNLLNRFGGVTNLTHNAAVSHTTDASLVHSGDGAMLMNVGVATGSFGFAITALGGTELNASYTDTRDLTAYESVRLYIRNRTGADFTFRFEVKDYRDDNAHRASQSFTIGAADQWVEVNISLDLSDPAWSIVGSPDLSRARQFALLVQADQGQAVYGNIAFDDISLIEPGGVLDPATAPLEDLVARLAERQFRAMWGARDPETGALETNSPFGRLLSMNTTGTLVKLLPGAIERGWITQAQADQFVQTLLNTLNTTMDNVQAAGDGGYLPPRYIDRATFTAASPYEESSIDAAFMFLALYQYKSQAGISSTLQTNVEAMLDRFNFAAFSSSNGWRMAWFENTHSFTGATYSGYGGENWVISLAAHLSTTHHVDITTHYNANVDRTKTYLVNAENYHLIHSNEAFRPPFVQWLFDLFVDTNDRGWDSYPNIWVRGNPFDNAVLYQKDVDDYFESIGRGLFLQPDAGSSGSQYQQFSAYANYGEPYVFMPWSVAFSLLGDPQGAEASLRNSLMHNLQGPFGLSDSAIWATGAAEPTSYPAANDLWNTSLSTMAMMEYLYDDNQAFTELPEVVAALDAVFPGTIIDGDLNKDGYVGLDDLDIVLENWNQTVAPGSYYSGDPTGDGYVGLDDLDIVLNNWNAGTPPAAEVEEVADEIVAASVTTMTSITSASSNQLARNSDTPDASHDSGNADASVALWQQKQAQSNAQQRFMFSTTSHNSGLLDNSIGLPSLGLWEPGDEYG